jgi:hypothetical protein
MPSSPYHLLNTIFIILLILLIHLSLFTIDKSPLNSMLWNIRGTARPSTLPTPEHNHPDISDTADAHVGTWHLSVECGPVQIISRASWRCIWSIFRSDMASGWGYDLYWGGLCGQGRTAVIDSQCVTHLNKKVASSEYNNAMDEYKIIGKLLDGKAGEPKWTDAERVTPATKKNVWHGPVRPIMLSDLDAPYQEQYKSLKR